LIFCARPPFFCEFPLFYASLPSFPPPHPFLALTKTLLISKRSKGEPPLSVAIQALCKRTFFLSRFFFPCVRRRGTSRAWKISLFDPFPPRSPHSQQVGSGLPWLAEHPLVFFSFCGEESLPLPSNFLVPFPLLVGEGVADESFFPRGKIFFGLSLCPFPLSKALSALFLFPDGAGGLIQLFLPFFVPFARDIGSFREKMRTAPR